MGDIVSRLVLKARGFDDPLQKSGQKVSRFSREGQRGFQDLGSSITRLGGILTTVFVTGAFARAITNAAKLGDELAKMSARTGLSVESLNGLTQAAKLADVSREQLQLGILQLNKNLLDTVRGTGEAKTSFEAMGVGAKEAADLLKTPEKAILAVADRLAAIRDPSVRAAEAMRIFGKSGALLLPLLNQGGEAIAKQITELQALRPITTEQAKASEAFNDSLTNLTAAFEGLTIRGVGPLLDPMAALIEQLTNLLSLDLESFGESLSRMLVGDFVPKAQELNYLLEERVRLIASIGKLQGDIASGNTFTKFFDEKGLDTLQDRLKDVNQEIGALQRKAKAGTVSGAPVDALGSGGTTTKNPFAITLDRHSPANPLTALAEIKKGLGDFQRGIGEAIVKNTGQEFFKVFLSDLKAQADEADFAKQLNENFITQQADIEARINFHKALLETTGKDVKENEKLKLLYKELNDLLGARQEELGRGIVDNGSAAFAQGERNRRAPLLEARQLAGFLSALNRTRTDSLGRPLPTQAGEAGLLRADEVRAERDLFVSDRRAAGTDTTKDFFQSLVLFEEQIASLDKTVTAIDFAETEANFQAVGSVISTTVDRMVQGLLLGTQSMADIWQNLLRNMAAQALSAGTQRLTASAATGLAGLLFPQAEGGVLGFQGPVPLQKFARGGVATRPTLALFGEGDQNEAFVPLPDGRRIPVNMKGGRTEVVVINQGPGQAEVTETNQSNGDRKIEVVVGAMLAKDIHKRGPLGQAIEKQFGLRRAGGAR